MHTDRLTSQDATNITFLVLDVGLTIENSAVFQAQVLDQAIALRRAGYAVSILCASKDTSKFMSIAGNKLKMHQIIVHLVPDRSLVSNIISFAVILNKLNRLNGLGTIYIRGFWAVLPIILASPLLRLRYVYDVRGDVIDESTARGRSVHRLFFLRIFETLGLRQAHKVTCVTTQLANTVKKRSRLNTLPDVIPCCIDLNDFSFSLPARESRRTELGYSSDDIVLVYSGGLAHYQMIREMLVLWRGLLSVSTGIKFLLMINTDPPTLEQSVGDLSEFGNRLRILNLARSDVFRTLAAGDVGFLLREDRALNATASPVKFAEYLAAGLAVISSPGLGDISNLIINRRLGILIRPSMESPALDEVATFFRLFDSDRVALRMRALEVVRESYHWDAYRQTYLKLYGQPAFDIN